MVGSAKLDMSQANFQDDGQVHFATNAKDKEIASCRNYGTCMEIKCSRRPVTSN